MSPDYALSGGSVGSIAVDIRIWCRREEVVGVEADHWADTRWSDCEIHNHTGIVSSERWTWLIWRGDLVVIFHVILLQSQRPCPRGGPRAAEPESQALRQLSVLPPLKTPSSGHHDAGVHARMGMVTRTSRPDLVGARVRVNFVRARACRCARRPQRCRSGPLRACRRGELTCPDAGPG